jgi:hypothetical protein
VSVTTVLYLVIIDSQGNVDTRRVAVWAVTLGTCASLGTVGSWSRQPRVRSIILATTAGALLGLGFLGIFSIGLLLIAAGVLLMVATVKAVAEDLRVPCCFRFFWVRPRLLEARFCCSGSPSSRGR